MILIRILKNIEIKMLPYYKDIISKLGEPLWYDQHGCPRYDEFKPELVSIYGDISGLVKIRCQSCDRILNVAFESSKIGRIEERYFNIGKELTEDSDIDFHYPTKDDPLEVGWYGDPPGHLNNKGEYCHCGCTMRSYMIGISEFWEKRNHTWKRNDEYEFYFNVEI